MVEGKVEKIDVGADLKLTPEARKIAELISVWFSATVWLTFFLYSVSHHGVNVMLSPLLLAQISPDMVNVTVNVGFNTKMAVEQILE